MKKILMLAFTATMMLSACKKDKSDDPEKVPACATENLKESYNGSSDSWSLPVKFDEQGRIKEGGDFSYEYATGRIIITDNYHKSTITHTLDAQNRIIKTVNGDETTDYKYDNNGYLIEDKTGDDIITYTWLNGNVVKVEFPWFTETITYGSDAVTDKLVAGHIFGEIYHLSESSYYLSDYYGKKPKNAPIKVEMGSGASLQTDTYTYTKDSKGNINAYKQTRSGATPWSFEYTVDYNCN